MATIAYARTSTFRQDAGLAAQERDLRAAGADRIISEKVSSVEEREGLDRCLSELQAGDVLMVTKIDRLARGTIGQLQMIENLTARGIGVVILSMFGGGQMDTRSAISKLILTVMAGVATYEREIMLERQKEGTAKAKAEGKFKGRKPRIARVSDPDWEFEQARRLQEGRKPLIDADALAAMARELGPAIAAREFGVGKSTVYRAMG